MGRLSASAPKVVGALGPAIEPAAEAIMTTDTRMKLATRAVTIGGIEVTLAACAKGAGMIAPQLATMLVFVVTDAAIGPVALQEALRKACDASFDRVVVDGDMSTNDAVFALANGRAGNQQIELDSPEF